MGNSIHDVVREKLAEAKKDMLRSVAEMHAQPRDIEAEVRCMWEMILSDGAYRTYEISS